MIEALRMPDLSNLVTLGRLQRHIDRQQWPDAYALLAEIETGKRERMERAAARRHNDFPEAA